MCVDLFPEGSSEEHERDLRVLLARDDATVFVAERDDGSVCGFVEAGTRPYVDGCDSSPVGYIEAWYVDPDSRRAGVGRALLNAAEGLGDRSRLHGDGLGCAVHGFGKTNKDDRR
jgi:aminoglycoside 6'-N-acetyltransferase I